jgi:hypothetical protein
VGNEGERGAGAGFGGRRFGIIEVGGNGGGGGGGGAVRGLTAVHALRIHHINEHLWREQHKPRI